MNAKAFHLSTQGASHIKKNKECQDASASYFDENCAIAIVCDGHGGDDYFRSAIGSKAGVEVAEKNIKDFIMNIDKETFFSKPEAHMKNLEASIINDWNESVMAYHRENPFTEKELSGISERARKRYQEGRKIESAYGTTLIAVAMNHDYWFGIHIGDGKCVAVNPAGEFKQPIPWDPKCFLNATTSICDSDAIDRFRHFYSEKLPAAVFVGSDGIDDCFRNNEQLHNLYRTVIYSFATSSFEEACDGLADYLPRLSAKGSGDDVSVAALLDLDLIPELTMVKEYDRDKEKARVEENARKEAEKNEEEKRRVEEEHTRYIQEQQKQQQRQQKPTQSIQRTREVRYCSYCGTKIDPRSNYCFSCGKIVDRKMDPVTEVVIDPPPIVTEPNTNLIEETTKEIPAVPTIEVATDVRTEPATVPVLEVIPDTEEKTVEVPASESIPEAEESISVPSETTASIDSEAIDAEKSKPKPAIESTVDIPVEPNESTIEEPQPVADIPAGLETSITEEPESGILKEPTSEALPEAELVEESALETSTEPEVSAPEESEETVPAESDTKAPVEVRWESNVEQHSMPGASFEIVTETIEVVSRYPDFPNEADNDNYRR